jgi:hypothetical protein
MLHVPNEVIDDRYFEEFDRGDFADCRAAARIDTLTQGLRTMLMNNRPGRVFTDSCLTDRTSRPKT